MTLEGLDTCIIKHLEQMSTEPKIHLKIYLFSNSNYDT